jgi:hypothetical protein
VKKLERLGSSLPGPGDNKVEPCRKLLVPDPYVASFSFLLLSSQAPRPCSPSSVASSRSPSSVASSRSPPYIASFPLLVLCGKLLAPGPLVASSRSSPSMASFLS